MKKISMSMKLISILTVFLILTLGLLGLLSSGAMTASALDTPYKEVKAGVFSFEGYHMKDENGGLTGYGIEFLNLVSQYSHLNFKYVEYNKTWGETQELLKNGDIDIATSASKTEEREEIFDFSLPIGRKKTVLSIRIDDKKFTRGSYSTYNGMRVGMLESNEQTQNEKFKEFAEDKFNYTKKLYKNDSELTAALQSGEDIDAILTSDLRKMENEQVLDVVDEDYFYAIVKKGNKELLDEINYAITQMDINEGDWQNELFYKYYSPYYSDALSFNDRELEYLQKVKSGEKTISVTAFGNRAPYSYTDNGELKGILPDYFAEIMKLVSTTSGLELPYNFIAPTDATDYDDLETDGRATIMLDRIDSDAILEGSTATCFKTNSYMTVRMARVIRQDHNGSIKTIAVSDSQGRDLVESIIQSSIQDYEIKPYSTGEDALRAVLNNEADVAYVYSYTAQYFINHGHAESLYYSSVNGMQTQFCMHISENTDHELLTILNKCIKQIPDDTLNQLALNYTITNSEIGFGEYLSKHPEIIIGIVLAIVVIISLVVTMYLRERWSKKLLTTTQQSSQNIGEYLAIVAALSRDYTNVFTVNEASGTARVIKLDRDVAKRLNRYSVDSPQEYEYSAIIENYIHYCVHPDDKHELTMLFDLNNVSEKLEEDNSYAGNYRTIDDDGTVNYFQYNFMKITDSRYGYGTYILVGFRNIDEMIRKEKEQNDKLAETLALLQDATNAKTADIGNVSPDANAPIDTQPIGFEQKVTTEPDVSNS